MIARREKPTIGAYYEDEESQLVEAIEATVDYDDFVPQSMMTPKRLASDIGQHVDTANLMTGLPLHAGGRSGWR